MSSLKVSSLNLNSGENTKITVAGNDLDLSISANGAERIRVDSNGRVGISTTTPNSTLDIVGNTNISTNLTVGTFATIGGNLTAGNISTTSANITNNLVTGNISAIGITVTRNIVAGNISVTGASIASNLIVNGGTLYVDSSVNEVGINITNPTSNLHVVGTNIANTANVTGNAVVTGTMFANNFVGYGTGFSNMQVFSTPSAVASLQSWSIPPGVRRFKVTLVGAGGSGGGVPAFPGAVGHGGGAGGYAVKYFNVIEGVTQLVSINVGTAGGISLTSFVSVNANGNTAWPSNVNYNNQWVFANAGTQGANGYFHSNVRTTAASGGSIGLGGDAAGGDLNIFGQDGYQGAGARAAAITVTANAAGLGAGGSPPLGWGFGGQSGLVGFGATPATGTYASGNGANAIGYGGGGGGARGGGGTNFSVNKAGGAGANGVVIIEW